MQRVPTRRRLHWQASAALVFAVATAGCSPMWYGPPPPTTAPGQGFPVTDLGMPATDLGRTMMVPLDSGSQQWSGESSADGSPPSTFQSSPAEGLNGVTDAHPDQVLPDKISNSETEFHEVQSGETLTSIAQKYGVTVDALKTANIIEEEIVLQPGQLIMIP